MMSRMRKNHLLGYVAIAVVCVMIGSAVTLAFQPVAQAEEKIVTTVVTSPFTDAIAQVRESVVGVRNYQIVRYGGRGMSGYYFGYGYGYSEPQEQEVQAATGSGVVVGEGIVLTNYHVVEDASSLKISVATDNAEEPDLYDAVLIAYDENLDIALLSVPGLPLAPVRLGDSDTLRVGDWAICIGNPLGETFSGTVTTGIVSALNRAVSSTSYDKYGRRETITNAMIQTDAAINSGNSGGGMFSVTGELMGIPTLKYTGSAYSGAAIDGIGMCIPINAAKPLIEDVLSGKIKIPEMPSSDDETQSSASGGSLIGKPRMGISIAGINTSHSAVREGLVPNGVYVSEVEAGSPAEKAGMKAGDIIVDVNDTVITSTTQLQSLLADAEAGDVLKVKVYRIPNVSTNSLTDEELGEGEYVDLTVVLEIIDDVKQ